MTMNDERTGEVNETSDLKTLRAVLLNESGDVPLAHRFRALFHLKSLAGPDEPEETYKQAIEIINDGFKDKSDLLKHELAYVLGQTRNMYACSFLRDILKDSAGQPVIVRHEAAEALGALGDKDSIALLEEHEKNDEDSSVRQTCELALERIRWENSEAAKKERLQESSYSSIDPAPPLPTDNNDNIEKLQKILVDTNEPLFQRYRAMFRLRDIGTDEAVLALATGFKDDSALFKHEIAYVFGQMCSPSSVPALIEVLKDTREAGMVRHEAAEALGSIATDEVLPVLKSFLNDEEDVVRESAVVALDMYEYETSGQIEYATVDV